MRRVKVLGLGNVLMGDDGFGPYAAGWAAAKWIFPPEVEVVDVGTPGLDLIPHVSDAEALIFLDTVHADAPAGALRLYRRDALLLAPPQPRLSPHDPGIREALFALELEGTCPRDVLLVGVVPGRIRTGPGLTTPVRAAVPGAVRAVVAELARLGIAVTRRNPPAEPDIWWERRSA